MKFQQTQKETHKIHFGRYCMKSIIKKKRLSQKGSLFTSLIFLFIGGFVNKIDKKRGGCLPLQSHQV